MTGNSAYEAIVLGASAGGMQLVKNLVTSLPNDFCLPLIIVQHIGENSDNVWPNLLNEYSQVLVKEADAQEPIQRGTVYLAPPNYHLLIEPDHSFTLTIDERVNYARPSIDVLFETAAEAYREKLIGIVCTGGNFDGAKGLLRIKELGGMTIAQNPETAEASAMPKAAIQKAHPDYILSPEGIQKLLFEIHTTKSTSHEPQN